MIPGDIDLTEKLDFRKVVKKKIPQLPSTWKRDRINLSNGNIAISNNTYLNFTYSNYSSSSISITTNSSHNDIRYYYQMDNYSYSITTNTSNFDSTMYYTISDINNNKKINATINKAEDEYDVFGNIKKPSKDIPKIPWRKNNKYSRCRSIAWDTHHYIYEDLEYEESIPWSIKNHHSRNNYNLTRKFDRAKNLVSWLSNKTSSFIENYFDSDDRVLSYLTNMSWIRIKDAIID